MTGCAGDRLRVLKASLDRLPPLSASSRAALAAWYDVELTYGSNALEGGALTRGEVALVLERGAMLGGRPLKDQLEALGHRDALHYVRALAAAHQRVRENDVREIHRLIAVRTDPAQAGRYRWRRRRGAPPPGEIISAINNFADWLVSAPGGREAAFVAHARLIAINPFQGGNGRVARLVMNLVLLRAGWPPVVIGPEHRGAYIGALQALRLRDDPQSYRRFMCDRLAASLDRDLAVRLGVTPPCAG